MKFIKLCYVPFIHCVLHACFTAADENHINNSVGGRTEIEDELKIPPDKFFLDKIFNKYGDGGIITFEGFEHLLDNLGLGGGVFNSPHGLELHRKNGTFQPIHDPGHRHKRHTKIESSTSLKECMTPQHILDVYGLQSPPEVISISPTTFLNLCPALVYQIDQGSCLQNSPLEVEIKDKYLAWIYAGLTVLLISAIGLLGAAIMPMAQSAIFQQILHFLVALAIGTLCGDAFLHLLPHALEHKLVKGKHVEDHNEPIFKCCLVLVTILLFYSVETIMRMVTGQSSHEHSHSGNRTERTINNSDEVEMYGMITDYKKKKIKKKMAPVALMVILGDGLHNLTDGLAIGAAFSSDLVTGFATAVAVFCHELPHELGDFAVLIRSGMTIKKALCYNVISSILSFIGTAIGLWLAEDHKTASEWIYAATAGTFLYIALADLVPEISANSTGKFIDFCLAFLGIVLGGIIMLSIALHEDKLKYLFNT